MAKARVIKFRGKRKGGEEWIIGDLNNIDGLVYIFDRSENAPTNSPDWFEVEPDTVGQFTGMLDVSGVEIFEGDILKWASSHIDGKHAGMIYNNAVEFRLSMIESQYIVRNGSFSRKLTKSSILNAHANIVGNITDNHDLLVK